MVMLFGVKPDNGLVMSTTDSDYQTAPCVIDVVSQAAKHGIFGYSWEYPEYLEAVQWRMKTRHNWNIDTDWILTSQGLANAIALCLDLWIKPGNSVIISTPVYHEFVLKIKRSGRKVIECPLVRETESYMIDFEDTQKRLTGAEKSYYGAHPRILLDAYKVKKS